MKITVLGGGDSPERDVSLRSARAVSEALDSAGFVTEFIDTSDIAALDKIPVGSIVFPILHGKNGEDGAIQAELEKRNLAYLGSVSDVSKICFDKNLTRHSFEELDLPIAAGDIVTPGSYPMHHLTKSPHVLKTNHGGSSIGTYIVRDPNRFDEQAVRDVFTFGSEAVIEELLIGTEITVPVLGTKALPVIEIIPPTDGEFDYKNKYNGQTRELCPPESVGETLQIKAQELAERAHGGLGCRHLSRTDMIIRPDGEIFLLEINTMPGMTNQSLYPKAALAAGISFPELVSMFVDMVKHDYGIL